MLHLYFVQNINAFEWRFVDCPLDLVPNETNWRIGNWHTAAGTLIAIIKAQRQSFPKGLNECITKNICDMLLFKNIEILARLNYLLIELVCSLYQKESLGLHDHN